MYCSNCGAYMKEGTNFCEQCGSRVENPSPQKKESQKVWDKIFTPELIEKARGKDERALAFLYEETVERIFAAVRSVVADEETAYDIVQDAYMKAFRVLGQLESPGAFPAWLMRIAMNRSYDYLRKKKPDIMFSSLEDDEGNAYEFEDTRAENLPHVVIEQREAADLLREILNEIPEEQRLCMTMFYYNQMDVKEIARELSCSEGTVKSRLFHGRRKMEVKIRELEKKGIKLYGLAPAALFLVILRNMEAAVPPSYVGEAVLAGTLNTSASTAVGTASIPKLGRGAMFGTKTGAVKAGAAKAGTAAAAKGVGLSMGKTIAIIAAVAAVGTAAAIHKPAPQVSEAVSESVSVPEITPEVTPEATPVVTQEASKPKTTPETTPKPKPTKQENNSGYASFEETYKVIEEHGFDTTLAGIIQEFPERNGRLSNLCFECKWDEMVDCGAYYEVPCILEDYIHMDEGAYAVGESVDICKNYLTDEWSTITLSSDGETWYEDDGREYTIETNSCLVFNESSYDFPTVPIYKGTIRVNKGASVGYAIEPEYTIETAGEYYRENVNGVYFKEDGHVSALVDFND